MFNEVRHHVIHPIEIDKDGLARSTRLLAIRGSDHTIDGAHHGLILVLGRWSLVGNLDKLFEKLLVSRPLDRFKHLALFVMLKQWLLHTSYDPLGLCEQQ